MWLGAYLSTGLSYLREVFQLTQKFDKKVITLLLCKDLLFCRKSPTNVIHHNGLVTDNDRCVSRYLDNY